MGWWILPIGVLTLSVRNGRRDLYKQQQQQRNMLPMVLLFLVFFKEASGKCDKESGDPVVYACFKSRVINMDHFYLTSVKTPTFQKETCFCDIKYTPRNLQASISVLTGGQDNFTFKLGQYTFNKTSPNATMYLSQTDSPTITYTGEKKSRDTSACLEVRGLSTASGTFFNVTCKQIRNEINGSSTTGISINTITATQTTKEGDTTPQGNDTTTHAAQKSQPNEKEPSDNKTLYIGVACGGAALIVIAILVVVVICRKRNSKSKSSNKESDDENEEVENAMYNVDTRDGKIRQEIRMTNAYSEPSDQYNTVSTTPTRTSAGEEHYIEPDDSYYSKKDSTGYTFVKKAQHGSTKTDNHAMSDTILNKKDNQPHYNSAEQSVYDHTSYQAKTIPFNEYSHIRNVPKQGNFGASNTYDVTDSVKRSKPERKRSEQDESYDTFAK